MISNKRLRVATCGNFKSVPKSPEITWAQLAPLGDKSTQLGRLKRLLDSHLLNLDQLN